MKQYKKDFLEFVQGIGALKFGEFTLKSGRKSPYFFNSGVFETGQTITKLGGFYADAIMHSTINYDTIFGPAYKGIPLAVTTSSALYHDHNQDIAYSFNRKEAKDHGEGGSLVGTDIKGKQVLIIDDVISSGLSVRESIEFITTQGGSPCGVIVALDRKERGEGNQTTHDEIADKYSIPVISIVTIEDVILYLEAQQNHAACEAIREYTVTYGITG